ncbi:hypothetical protein [Streptomyces sp. NBC_00687]|uniref:hypothetical protein n=1 Tax=Streptomyces sp. NBC_00687 TaxID=2975807 RepID=UPI0022520A85|nr:hypothetical protein [Streptomyces sp. NBC_00687]MCX4920210.1 hypothetical protein [Streptomyces sp. NBC_00687]
MTKHHALKKELRRRMKETGQSYQEILRESREGTEQITRPQLENADRREDFIDAVHGAALPQMVKVLLFELASRLDVTLSDYHKDCDRVRFEEEELAASIGLDEEAANLCRYLAIEANWMTEVEEGVVELRTPHYDWDLYLGALQALKTPVEDRAIFRGRLAAFEADVEHRKTHPKMSVRRIQEMMLATLGHTWIPRCTGDPLAGTSHGLGSGQYGALD